MGQRGFLDEVFDDLGDIGRDLLGKNGHTATGRAASSPPRPDEPRDRFIPVSPAPIAVLAAIYATDSGATLTTAGIAPLRKVGAVVEAASHWSVVLIAAAVLAVIIDLARFVSHRHRSALHRTIAQATGRDPLRVRVPWQIPGVLRSASVRMPRGTVIPSDRLTKLRAAIEASDKLTIATGSGWDDDDLDEENI